MIRKELFLLLVILAIASFSRLWQLDSIPPGLYPDVALNGNEALHSLKTGDFKVFYPENNGREGLMMWLIAGSFSIFGVSVWSIKIVAALAGIFTVLGLYLLTKELFAKYAENTSRYIALLSSFFLATSFWHTNFSRIGFRAILLPLISVFAFYFLFRAFRIKKLRDFIFSGIFFGLGFYTYTSYRMIILLFPLMLICLPFFKKDKKMLSVIGSWLLVIFVVALPLGIYFLQNPQDFMSRMTGVSIFAQTNPLLAFGKSLIAHLGMFNFYGDANWRHNFSGSPMLPWSLGVLFLIGVISSIKKIFLAIKTKNHQHLMTPIFLTSWFFVMLLPGVLTYEGIPHALRVVGVIPVVYIFVALGSWWLYEKLKQFVKNKRLLSVIGYFLLVLIGYSEFNKYFFVWAKNPNVQGAFTTNYVEIGNQLNSLPENVQKYVIVNEGGTPVPYPDGTPMPAQTPMFIERIKFDEPRATYLLPEDLNKIQNPEKAIIIFLR
ncbi:MAG: glycosyltransferase family 39 protein [Candidatus Wildermuthbacteria bacterium]|nr:glycosyltransferase family 39 protein [Candidatus Wildermuthbacteria bacterium]